MSFETELDTAFTILLGKARSTITQTDPSTSTTPPTTTDITIPTSYTVPFVWGGGGAALAAASTDPILVEVPDAGEIVWCHLYAGSSAGAPVAVTTNLDLQKTTWANFGSSTSVSGSGSNPRISSDSEANMNLSGWNTHLDAGDTLIARITTFSGTARFVAMVLKVRRDSTG